MYCLKTNRLFLSIKVALLIAFLASCSPVNQMHSLTFQPAFEGKKLSCGDSFSYADKAWRLSQLQFYVSKLSIYQNGESLPVLLKPNQWQNDGVTLIGGACGGDFNWKLSFESPVSLIQQVDKIEFTIGVPFEVNHLNPLTQSSPLNQSDMFWTWQLGHKFFRLDIESEEMGWAFHSGSMGCESPSPMRAPKEACKLSNRAKVVLSDVDLNESISVDIAKLLSGINLNEDTRCMSSPDTPSCEILLKRLGVNKNSVVFSGVQR